MSRKYERIGRLKQYNYICQLAFGGFKQSGQGREIGSYGFEEFLEVKSVVMRIGRSRAPWVNSAL